MVSWRVTAASVYCEEAGVEVTVMVYKDGAAVCTGQRRLGAPGSRGDNRSRRERRCSGPECKIVSGYRDRLFNEESSKTGVAGS